MARHDVARLGRARQAWLGETRAGMARLGRHNTRTFGQVKEYDRMRHAKRRCTWWVLPLKPDPQLRRVLPNGEGVYAVIADGECIYVGQSLNLRERLLTYGFKYHKKSDTWVCRWGEFKTITLKYRPPRCYGEWAMAELRLIRRLQPRYNVRSRKGGVMYG